MKMNIKNRGFTIVELLVVIVVIGILAAITMVSYSGVTSKANAASNKANAASIMQAADAYFAENGSYPTSDNLSAGAVKVPSSITVIGTVPTSAAPSSITYVQAATGYCIQYWDPSQATPAKATLATAGTGANCF